MKNLEHIRAALPEAAKDIQLNLQSVLQEGTLSPSQRWGVAVASAIAARNPRLRDAVAADAREAVGPAVLDDACAAASLMGMSNIFYRFRQMVAKPIYSEKPARLRMNRLARPATSKTDLELFSLAVSTINGCESCVRAHERVVLSAGMTEDQVNDAVRIAATIHAAAVALEGSATLSSASTMDAAPVARA
jgi:alkyl hydroperoxide reductase subunit D